MKNLLIGMILFSSISAFAMDDLILDKTFENPSSIVIKCYHDHVGTSITFINETKIRVYRVYTEDQIKYEVYASDGKRFILRASCDNIGFNM